MLASTAVAQRGDGHGTERELFVTVAPGTLDYAQLGTLAPNRQQDVSEAWVAKTISMRATRIDMSMILRSSKVCMRCLALAKFGQSQLLSGRVA